MLLDMIMAALLKHIIELPPGYNNYWGHTKRKLQKLTQLQVMQGFLSTGMWQQQHEYYVRMRSKKKAFYRALHCAKK